MRPAADRKRAALRRTHGAGCWHSRFNDLDLKQILADEDLCCWLICEWYVAHIAAGGEPNLGAKQILEEVAEPEATGIAALQQGSGIPK